METISIEIVNPKAKNLLKDMEDLELIKVLGKVMTNRPKASEMFKNGISFEYGEKLINFSKKSREEWERNI